MAPSAIAAAIGIPVSATAVQATAAVVSRTATAARASNGTQWRRNSRGGRS